MKFILINPERVNVYLTKEDMISENIILEELYQKNSQSEIRLNNIFNMAKRVNGFNQGGSQYEIDVIPIMGGELLLSISRVDEEKERVYIKGHNLCFYSKDIENIIEALLQIKGHYYGETKVYSYDNKYYILIKIFRIEIHKLSSLKCILNEYIKESNVANIVIEEHGKCIIEHDAIVTATKYFKE